MEMIKHNLIFLALSLLLSFVANAQVQAGRHELKVGEFKSLSVVDNISVTYSCNPDSAGLAVFYCSDDMAKHLLIDNNGHGKLSVRVATDAVNTPGMPSVHVYSTFLQEASNESDSVLRILNIAPAPSVKLKLTDNGKIIANGLNATEVEAKIITGKGLIIVNGKCKKASLGNMGTGEVQADKLEATDVNCSLTGTGAIGCFVNGGVLSVKGLGTGKIYYRGTPSKIKKFKLGSIKTIPLDEK
jgi:hypothetical protein